MSKLIDFQQYKDKERKDADLSLCVGRFCGNYNN